MGDQNILEQLHELDSELKSFPPEAHWFCPRRSNDDPVDYEHPDETEEDMTLEVKRKLLKDAKRRHQVAYKYSIVLGMDKSMSGDMREVYEDKLHSLLTVCDKCIHNWHLGRKTYLKDLSEQFDEDVVSAMAGLLKDIDFARLDKGLASGREILSKIDAAQRTQSSLIKHDPAAPTALLALYEALCCVEYHRDDNLLSNHFDYVFEQIQSRKVLRMTDTLPATARFLFSDNPIRHRFATSAWQKMENKLTASMFDWVVHDVLAEAIVAVAHVSADSESIRRFWQGFLLILSKMDKDLITHRLRGMEVQPDVYRLALQHLAANSGTIVQLVIDALRILLEKAPEDFWSAMGTISPSLVVDQILGGPGFQRLLSNPQSFENAQASPAISWIPVFLNSIKADHKPKALRSILGFLLAPERFQATTFSDKSRLACCAAGFDALYHTLETYNQSTFKLNGVSLIVISEVMALVKTYKDLITGFADQAENVELKKLGMLVIKSALTLDCKSIKTELEEFQKGQPVQRGLRDHSQPIWQAVLDIFRPGNIDLAKSIIPAILSLAGLDKIQPKNRKASVVLPADQAQFNKDLDELMDNISRIIDRLSDFSSLDLGEFSQDPSITRPLFASLISSNQSVCQATVEVIKAMTGEDGRQDAIQNLLETSFCQVLNALSYSVNQTTRFRTFGSIPYTIKINHEVLKALTGNTGVLRARPGFSKADQNAITAWWTSQWRALENTFRMTENWAPSVERSTSEMQDFCRDVMEYAEALFDQYSIFASALKSSSPALSDDEGNSNLKLSSSDAIRKVLQVICENLGGMVGWLRLRDGYLISVIAKLLGKLLRVLGEYHLEVDDETAKYINTACRPGQDPSVTRTNLTLQQKAELQRALDDHQGLEVIEISNVPSIFKKQATIDSWSKSADGKQYEPRLPAKSESKSDGIVRSTDKHRALLNQFKSEKAESSAMSSEAREAFKENRRRAAEDQKRRNAEAVAKARALRAPAIIRGEGSGISGIGGVAGKDHAPIRSEIMVGSSDEDSDDDDDEDETNALVKRRKETNKTVAEYQASRQRAMKQMNSGPIKKTKVQRSAKDLRARIEPNMDALYLEILKWEIFHTGDNPPSNNECRKIDNRYLDLNLYKTTFGPLLISEVWRSLVTARDENNYKPIEIKVMNRLSVDKFMEVSTNMPMSKNRDLLVSERDIVLLSQSPDPMNSQSQPHCLARVARTTRKKDVLEVTYLISRDTKTALLQCFVPNGKVYAVKIADMTTTQREYAALSSLEYYDLCSEVLEAKPSPLQKYSDEKISIVSSKYNLNRGQAQAILSANDNDGFTLIQGPPGSGKTKTIVAMVGSLLTQTLQQQAQQQVQQRPPVQGQQTAVPAPKKKLLICAPSNAAVDELVVRLKEGIQPLNGPRQKINVIRIGRSDAINAAVKDVMLDELVQKKLEGDNGEKNKLFMEREKLHKEAAQIKDRLNVIRPLMDEARNENDTIKERNLRQEFDQLKRGQALLGAKFDEDKQSGNTFSRQNEINRRRFQQEIIDGAHVLCSTLSGSGHDMFRNINVEFETVIIDEAAQCIELSALIPLKYGCSKCILVGDPEQLPPTVLSRSAQSFGYEQSLFVRMQKNHPKDVHLLDTQYRMHPEISSFPSEQFYNSKLIDGPGMAKLREQPWHASTILGPYRFFDVEGIQTKQAQGHSFINVPELNAALQLFARLKADYPKVDFKGKIGIITSYKAQLNEMKARFARMYGDSIFDEIEFNTTDAFQGREREIIIFSCVRAKATGGIGFLGDIRRMNVGLTRAKSSLWVLGDSRSLRQGQFWNRLIEDAQARGRYTTGNVMELLSKPTARGGQPPVVARQPQGNGTAAQTNFGAPSVSSNGDGIPSRPMDEDEDGDIEMIDRPSLPSSRNSSVSGSASAVSTNGHRAQNLLGIKQEPRKLSGTPRNISDSANPAKRSRDSEEQEEQGQGPSKKAHPTPPPQISSIEAALQAQQAAKAKPTGPRPRPPGGVAPPRRPKPAQDPFIQRKPPKRN